MNDRWETDLLRHERFLLRLASRLAGPEVEAEDLVQDAFVRALERPPHAAGGAGALRAWLATVLRRSAGRSARGARRRADRERRVAAPEAREDPDRIEARLEAHAELLALLRDLPAGERRALFLRYAEDLAPPAIALRLGVPLETVRTRLRRGRERLRARLDDRHGGRAAWAALLLPPSSPLHPTTASAPPGAASSPAASAAAQVGAGVLMGTTAKVLVGAAACAASLVLVLRGGGAPAPDAVAHAPAHPEAPPALAGELRGAAGPLAEARVPADAAADVPDAAGERGGAAAALPPADVPGPPAWPLVVRAEGAPAAGAALRIRGKLDAFGRPGPPDVEARIGADGTARVDVGPHLAALLERADGARPEELIVELDHPGLVPAEGSLLLPDPFDLERPPDEPLVVVVRVSRAAVVVGRVVGRSGAPHDGETFVQAHPRRGESLEREPTGHVEPDADGAFRLRIDGEGPHALLAIGAGSRPATALPVLARGAAVDVGDLVLSEGLGIDGRAVDLSGAPRADANVFAMLLDAPVVVELSTHSFELPRHHVWHAGAFELFATQTKTAADGAFRLTGLGPHRYQLDTQAPHVGVPFALADKPEVTAPATVELRPQAAELRLAFDVPGGVLPEGAGTWTRAGQEKHFHLPLQALADGRTLRYALPPNEGLRLVLDLDGHAPVDLAIDTPGVGGVVERDVRLVPDAAAARLVLVLRGVPVVDGTRFVARLDSGGRMRERELATSRGELVLDELTAGPLALELTAGDDRFAPLDHLRTVALELDLAPGEDRRVDVTLERGGTLILEALTPAGERVYARCVVRDAAGEPVELDFVARIPDGRVAGPGILFPGGPSRAVPELTPGRYRATLTAAGFEPAEVELAIEGGATTERSVTLRPRR